MKVSENKAQRLMLLGAVSQMPAEDQAKVQAACEHLRGYVEAQGDAGFIALTLVMSELAVKMEGGGL